MITSHQTDLLAKSPSQEVLRGVLEASSEACWCMEFGIPVDVTAPDSEVVRQVFENDPYWSFANPAMAQLYLLPSDHTLTDRPVAEIFPRNPQNEEFVLNLIANGFEVDAAPARDTRYDNVQIEVENDVRAHIEGGRLLRMFGNVRDVGKHRRREAALAHQLRLAQTVLGFLPMPVLALGDTGNILFANAAATRLLGASEADLLGREYAPVLNGGPRDRRALVAAIDNVIAAPFPTPQDIHVDGEEHLWTITNSPADDAIAVIVSAAPNRPEV
ncbi:PAS domain-containing protein [Nitratireductor aquibiodomus]|nr:PAS domain-containing protein [Nitratireductor aquibiodomus]